MLDKLFNYFIGVSLGYPMISILIFFLVQKYLFNRKDKRTERVDASAIKVSAKFNFLLKNRIINRSEILTICDMLSKYSQRKYCNDAEMIYSILKHAPLRLSDVATLDVYLDTIIKKNKKKIKQLK